MSLTLATCLSTFFGIIFAILLDRKMYGAWLWDD
jgi:ABC-type Fe3+ transport system permease subunit